MLLEIERQFLLKVAREAIISAARRSTAPAVAPLTKATTELRGAFVTLHSGIELRGCIGYADPLHPLTETVCMCAMKAATEDLRFQPVTNEELQSIIIEISVLSEMKPISDYRNITIGIHGLMLQTESRRGLLLPQVAVQHGWDQLTFLQNVSKKAGLPSDGWKFPNVQVFTFTAEVFQEQQDAINA